MKFAVVIPFSQQQRGILSKAVDSVLRQTLPAARVEIIVVDDESPVCAREELAGTMALHPGRIRIIKQAKGGPAAARNKALDNIAQEVQFVAFLDSDDEWSPEHLANADRALKGTDFYFSDHCQRGQTLSAFQRDGRIVPEQHRSIVGTLHKYDGDMFDQILGGNVIGTSTVVYRFRKFTKLRFREAYMNAGEDYLFWLELSKLTSRISFSTACECTEDESGNIFSPSGSGSDKSLSQLHYEIKAKKALPRIFLLSQAQKTAAEAAVKALRRSFVADTLHRLAHRKPLGGKLLISHAFVDPQSFLFFAPIAAGIALRR